MTRIAASGIRQKERRRAELCKSAGCGGRWDQWMWSVIYWKGVVTMKYACAFLLLGVVLVLAPPAWAQYGLYGSPDMLTLPPGTPHYAYPSTVAPRPLASSAADQLAYAPTKPAPSPSRKQQLEPVGRKGPSTITQMLDEAPQPVAPGGYSCNLGCDADYGCGMGSMGCEPCCAPLWYARAAWLTMGRDRPNTVWTTYEAGNNANQLPTEFDVEWGNGGQITIGRDFCCGCWSLEGTYWGLTPLEGQVSVTHVNGVSTPLDFTDVVYANPALAGFMPVDLFDGADEHRVSRRDEVHNVELNLVRNANCGAVCNPCGARLDIDWLVGVRYFRFDEEWAFRSLQSGGSWANPLTVGNLEDRITNNLVGFQFGFNVDYQCHPNVRLFARPKFGIYNNQINNTFRAYRSDGENFGPDPASGVPGTFPVQSTSDSLSFLTEIDLGLAWQFNPRWAATVGYRVVAATGIGLADNQIPHYVVDIPEIAAIDRNGQLVLHGAFAGLEYRF
jgi:hypothetical protein